MFPWTDGFRWTVGHGVFLSLFFAVVLTILTTFVSAVRRAAHDLRTHSAAELCWQSDFASFPESERRCRHELASRVASRICDNAFDCRRCAVYPQLAALPPSETECDLGLHYCKDRFYHRGHTWVEPQEDGTVALGLDEFAEHLIGRPDSVAMPEAGCEIELNATAWHLKKDGKDIQVRAPVEGKVIAIGSPQEGWYLKIRPRSDPHDPATLRHLLRGREVQGWLIRELERLQLQLRNLNTAPTLADGGVLIPDLMDVIPDADWDTVLADTFLEG